MNHILYNPKTNKVYKFRGTYYGGSDEYVDNFIKYVESLEKEIAELKRQMKCIKVSDVDMQAVFGYDQN